MSHPSRYQLGTHPPKCKQCDKLLSANYTAVCTACGKPDYKHRLSSGGDPRGDGACELISSRWVPEEEQVKTRMILAGYGYHNNGKFCTLRCGYYWALERA